MELPLTHPLIRTGSAKKIVMLTRIILVALLLAAVFGGIFGWKHFAAQQAAAKAGGPPPPVIAAARAEHEVWQPYLQVVGSLSAVAGIEVTSEVAGQIRMIHFNSGEGVKQGDLLLELDDRTDQAQLQGLLAERTLARLKFERTAKLIKDKSVSKEDYDEARATLDATEARVSGQQALIDKKRIRAPFDGRLGIRRVDLGEYLTPGAAIVPLEKLDPIYVDFTLPERELARIRDGQGVEIRVQAYPDEIFRGSIIAIDPGVEVGSRSFRVRGQEERVITIPDTAISYAPYGDSVFVIEDSEGQTTVSRRQIETGKSRAGRVAVVSGLQAGERVVSAGHNKLRNGQRVASDSRPAPASRDAVAGPGA